MGLSNEKQKLVDRLKASRLRAKSGSFLVEGIRGTREFLQATLPLKIRFALVSPRLEELRGGAALRETLAGSRVPVEVLTDVELGELSATENPQGVILVVDEPASPGLGWEEMSNPRVLFLDGIQDPGNVGTLIRTARAFGLDGVVVLDGSADPWGPKVVRASAGALAHTPVRRASWDQARDWIQKWSIPILAATAGGEDVQEIGITGGWALFVGNEGAGVRLEIREESQHLLAIPMAPGVDSLNVATAGAILLFALGGVPSKRDAE